MERKNNTAVMAVLILLLLLIAFVTFAGYRENKKMKERSASADSKTMTLFLSVLDKNESRQYEIGNASALAVLQIDHDVNVTYSSFGAFITCIDEVCSNDNYYWLYYVNNNFGQVSADSYYPVQGDIVEFRYNKAEF